jgi:hypothetical protein
MCSFFQVFNHNHSVDDSPIARGLFTNALKDDVASHPIMPVRRIYDDAIARAPVLDSDDDDFLPEFSSVSSALKRRRLQCYPPVPQCVNDVHMEGTQVARPSSAVLGCAWAFGLGQPTCEPGYKRIRARFGPAYLG